MMYWNKAGGPQPVEPLCDKRQPLHSVIHLRQHIQILKTDPLTSQRAVYSHNSTSFNGKWLRVSCQEFNKLRNDTVIDTINPPLERCEAKSSLAQGWTSS